MTNAVRHDCLGRPIRAKAPFRRSDRPSSPMLGVWRLQAACIGHPYPETWFPPPGSRGHEAKRICDSCPVVAECLEYSLEYPQAGIWGGCTENERKEILRGLRSRKADHPSPKRECRKCRRCGEDRTLRHLCRDRVSR